MAANEGSPVGGVAGGRVRRVTLRSLTAARSACVVAAAGTLAWAIAIAGAGERACRRGGVTLAQGRYLRVYRADNRTFACLASDGRRFEVGELEYTSGSDGRRTVAGVATEIERPIAVGGAFVAVREVGLRDDDAVPAIKVYDVRRRRLVRTLPLGDAVSLVVAAHRGWVALVVPGTAAVAGLPATPTTVVVADGVGYPAVRYRTVGSGPAITPASLRLRGRTVTWVDGDQRRTFRLGMPPG